MEFKHSISEVSSKTGISSSAINYYIRSKLITPPKKTSKTRALFSEQTINELLEIKKLKSQGLPIKLIKSNLDKKENIYPWDLTNIIYNSRKSIDVKLLNSFTFNDDFHKVTK